MKRRGYTLTEVTIAITMMAVIFAAAMGIVSTTIKSFTFTNNQYDADMDASLALQLMNRSLQEAKTVTIVSPTSIRVSYLKKDANGIYIRNTTDTTNYVDIYRGNANLTANTTGPCLVLKPGVGTGRVICNNVTALEFRSFTDSSIDVTLKSEYGLAPNKRYCQMIHRAIFLRNY